MTITKPTVARKMENLRNEITRADRDMENARAHCYEEVRTLGMEQVFLDKCLRIVAEAHTKVELLNGLAVVNDVIYSENQTGSFKSFARKVRAKIGI